MSSKQQQDVLTSKDNPDGRMQSAIRDLAPKEGADAAVKGCAELRRFIKSPDVAGESSDGGHKGEIDLVSWSWGK